MKSAGGSGWSLLPSLWVCAVGGGNGGRVPVLCLPWVTLPSPRGGRAVSVRNPQGRKSLAYPSALPPHLPPSRPGEGEGDNAEEMGGRHLGEGASSSVLVLAIVSALTPVPFLLRIPLPFSDPSLL